MKDKFQNKNQSNNNENFSNPNELEKKWQEKWEKQEIYKTDLNNTKKTKYYNLVMFPYPSGDKLHIGHWYNYGSADSWGRYVRMKGYNVFEPMGFDSFGLPAENYAIATGISPKQSTEKNVAYMKKQLKRIGGIYDWEKTVNTSQPEYYKWTQWLFLQMYKQKLAYKKKARVNYCSKCETVLANEQVWEGKCERCKNEVAQKELEQWFFKTTKYAQKLLDNLEKLDWPEKTKIMQRNWIGRSEGCDVSWKVKNSEIILDTFTTTVDTIYGVTFVVISPEHPLLEKLIQNNQKTEVENYIKQASKKTEIDRTAEGKEKTGVFTGSYVTHPFTGEKIPLYVADYVLMNYGTGVVMGVPAHDQRDMDFAKKYKFPIIKSIENDKGESFVYDDVDKYNVKGQIIDSGEFTNLNILEGRKIIVKKLEEKEIGQKKIQYKLRDWLISRQRYWGAPIPIIYCEKCGEVPVPEEDLPVILPDDVDYKPTGGEISPLATSENFVNCKCPKCGIDAKREVDTMDTFVCSSWYFLRYLSVNDTKTAFDKEIIKKWMPIDMYIGGSEHACMHLIYARFVMMALFDMGFVSCDEPFKKLVHQGLVTKDGAKMSKSKGNAVSPDEFVEQYGSDVFRMYLMFMGPFTEGGDWNDKGIKGVARFRERFWKIIINSQQNIKDKEKLDKEINKLIKKVTEDIEKLHFNTMIAGLMEFINFAIKNGIDKKTKIILSKLIAPVAPHLAEECFEFLEEKESVMDSQWPSYDEEKVVDDVVVLGIQVNGKVRGEIEISKDASQEKALSMAKKQVNVKKHLENGEIIKEIYVPGRIVGFVVKTL